MPKQVITITHQQHADVLSAVGGQNGLNVTEVGIYKDGVLVAYDEVRLVADEFQLKVRSCPEDSYSDKIQKQLDRYLLKGFTQEEEEQADDQDSSG